MKVRRREILTTAAVVLSGTSAGCGDLSTSAGSSASTSEAPTSPDTVSTCTATSLPQPTPESSEPNRADYPTFPDELTPDTTSSFATDFEYAYRWNDVLQEIEAVDHVKIRHGVEATLEAGDGYDVAVGGEEIAGRNADTDTSGTDTARSSLIGNLSFAVWYRVGPRRVKRVHVGGGFEAEHPTPPPSFEDADTVLCP